MITIYDTDKATNHQVSFNKGEVKKLFIADNGDILISSNKVYLLRKENSYKVVELNVNGEALGFNNNEAVYFYDGSIYKYDLKDSTKINEIGKDYSLLKEDSKNIIFSNDKKLMVYNIKSNELYGYSSKYLETSKNFSPDLKRFINNDAGNVRIIDSDGTDSEIAGSGYPFDYYWLDNNTLVRIPFRENPKYLGDFVIEKVDITTGKSSTMYEMK